MQKLSEYLITVPNLQELNLSNPYNNIRYIGIIAIGEIGIMALAQTLKFIPKLQLLDLGNILNEILVK